MTGSGSSVPGNPPVRRTLLHLAPHPDDELMGGPAIMLALQASGHRIVNLACGLGRPEGRQRREAEARESARRTGFELIIASPSVAIGSGDDLEAAQAELAPRIADLVRAEGVEIVFSPSPHDRHPGHEEIVFSPRPHDRHPGHEAVGRAALEALASLGNRAPAWWMWGLWADLPFPILIAYFGSERLDQILHALEAHAGELERNDYRRLVRGRAAANAVLGPERVFGFGARGRPAGFAELATEVIFRDGNWLLGRPRELDPREPLAEPTRTSLSAWLEEPSLTQRFGAPGGAPP